jgi:hypothetical protein
MCGHSSSMSEDASAACCSSATTEICGKATCKTVFLPFSQGENRARDYAGIDPFDYASESDETRWYFTANVAYQENFKRDDLGAYFFPNGTNTLRVGTDQLLDPTSNADVSNFEILLSDTFVGTLTISPRIRNVIIEPTLYIGLDNYIEGAWFWTKIPIVNTRWFLDCCETVSNGGMPLFEIENEFSSAVLFSPAPAFGTENQIQQAFGGVLTVGDYHQPLSAGKILCCESKTTGIADFPVHLGYNFIRKDSGYLGIYARAVFPTGKVKNRRSLFDATIGYKRWQFGVGFDAGLILWDNDVSSVKLIADAYYTHIFNTSQCRLFDLKNNGCFSRYLTLFEGLNTVNANHAANVSQSNILYTGNLVPFANVFNICVESGFDWNFDGTIFLQARHNKWLFDLGYELKARAHETLSFKAVNSHACNPCDEGCTDCCTTTSAQNNKSYTIKSFLGVTFAENTSLVPQFASINTARINNGSPGGILLDEPNIFITPQNIESQLDFCAGRIPQALSHKLWGHVGYALDGNNHPITIGLGAEVEFGNKNKALSLWSIWAKAGIAYD